MPQDVGERILNDKLQRGIITPDQVSDPDLRREIIKGYNESYLRVLAREATLALRARHINPKAFLALVEKQDFQAAMAILQREVGLSVAERIHTEAVIEVTRGRAS